MPDRMSRRRFLRCSRRKAVGVFAMATVGPGLSAAVAQDTAGANDRVGLGLIGCGRRGSQLLEYALELQGVRIPVVCDVDSQRAGAASDRITKAGQPKPAITSDDREVLDHPAVHGVIIATPDHWHAIQHLRACAAVKDVYVENPISYNITEGQAMLAMTRKYNRVVQVGLQHRSSDTFDEAVRLIRTKRVGHIAQTRTWTFSRIPPIPRKPDGKSPPHLDYDRWLGPAPERTYNAERVEHHFSEWWDYSGGRICQWNPHLQDVVHRAMRTTSPSSVSAIGGNYGLNDFRETPDTLEAVFEYQGVHGPFVHVYSLRLSNAAAAWGPPNRPANGRTASGHPLHYGIQFHGDQGTLFVDRDRIYVLDAESKPADIPGGEVKSDPAHSDRLTRAHLADFVACMVTRASPKATIEAGHFALSPCHLANIAYRLGQKIYIEPQWQKCFRTDKHETPDTEANALRVRQYRVPYVFPKV